jgi:hypothetical protein
MVDEMMEKGKRSRRRRRRTFSTEVERLIGEVENNMWSIPAPKLISDARGDVAVSWQSRK